MSGPAWSRRLSVLVLAATVFWGGMPEVSAEEIPEAPQQQEFGESERRSLDELSREELEELGFVFEDILTERERAHATIFGMTAGIVVPGAAHWFLDDTPTALALAGNDLIGWTLLASGVGLALNPTGHRRLDDARHDLWFGGIGMLGASWLIDVFGSAYRDDLGIPQSTRREAGYGAGLSYRYWQPAGVDLRHMVAADVGVRGRNYDIEVSIGQGLDMGMSDLGAVVQWFPLVGPSPTTRLGVEMSGRYRWMDFDVSRRRGDAAAMVRGSVDLGRFSPHLDQLTVGAAAGGRLPVIRATDEQGRPGDHRIGRWRVPLEMSMALNLTDQLRFDISWERNTGHWLQRSSGQLGVPGFGLDYRSTDHLDLRFFGAFGNGVGFGAGLRAWFGE